MESNNHVVQLNSQDLIGEGVYQKCYTHPAMVNLCIKIEKPSAPDTRLINEIKHWKRISKKRIDANDSLFFSKYYGTVETNLGIGHIYDLIVDEHTHEVSRTLEHYLLTPTEGINDDMLKIGWNRLLQLMVKYKVIANDLRAKNICCKRLHDKGVELVLIDGVGHRDFIPLVNHIQFLARRKIERRLIKHKLVHLEVHRNFLLPEYSV